MHSVIIDERECSEEEHVDFSNASLYLSAIQTILSVQACAFTAILSCWVLPSSMVSAVRTLTLTCLVGVLTMRKPLRIGQVHGLNLVFSALKPAVVVYISCLVIETLLHTCTQESDEVPSWRRLVFQIAVFVMMVSGMVRAHRPLSETDMPFLVTAASLLLVAILPPPAVSMQGPLCQSVSFGGAAERMTRALVFSCVYSLFVYISSPVDSRCGGTVVCIMRASASSVWVLGAALPLLVFALPQCGIAIWARLRIEETAQIPLFPADGKNGRASTKIDNNHCKHYNQYNQLATRTPPSETNDMEVNVDDSLAQPCINGSEHHPAHSLPALQPGQSPAPSNPLSRNIGPLTFRQVTLSAQPRPAHSAASIASKERMAEIAASITEV
jgi:hypothetical protein